MAPCTELIPFDFEGRPVRVVTDAQGEPWFVAADVCAVLELPNTTRALARLDPDEQALISIQGISRGNDQVNVVNEPGLYSLVLGSRKREAKHFKRWVTHEVLPAIRKTGSYTAPSARPTLPAPTQDRVAALLLIGEAVAKVPGVKPGIAMAATLSCIQENTGLAVETLRRALPARDTAANEAVQHSAAELTLLTKDEQQLYRDLKQQRWGQNVRLEQERIDWTTAWNVLQGSLA